MNISPDYLDFEVLAAKRSVLGSEWGRDAGTDPYSRIYFIESGAGHLFHNGARFRLLPGHIYLIPAFSELAFGCEGEIVIQWLHFTAFFSNGLDFFESVNCPYEFAPGRDIAFVRSLFRRLITSFSRRGTFSELEIRGCLLMLISIFLEGADSGKLPVINSKNNRFGKVLRHMHGNPARTSVKSMASMMNMAPDSFSHSFKRAFGVGPAQYAMRKKIDRVKSVLASTDRKLEDIASEYGFTDAFHMSRTFRKFTGLPPSDFRNSRLETIP